MSVMVHSMLALSIFNHHRNTWYQPDENDQMRVHCVRLLDRVQKNLLTPFKKKRYCTRGLESVTGPAYDAKKILRNILLDRVLQIQEEFHIHSSPPLFTAHVLAWECRKLSKESQQKALKIAELDAKEATRYYNAKEIPSTKKPMQTFVQKNKHTTHTHRAYTIGWIRV
jgi:hypothetical protein